MLSLVLPTYNESKNLPILIPKIDDALKGLDYEIIIVDDDSPDETWRIGKELAADRDNLHVIRRIGRRGLSSAVIEGFLAANGTVYAVMDADGQHDVGLLVKLYGAVTKNGGLAQGSRYMEGGSVGEWDERRHLMSRVATRMALAVCKVKSTDPMSGFFALSSELFDDVVERLNPKGFKILLDILVHAPKQTVVTELPFTFAQRMHGESKLSKKVQIEFLEYLYDVTVGRYIPLTFVKYCMVGALGVVVHVSAYTIYSMLLSRGQDITLAGFSISLIGAIETAIIFNFWLNNMWTFATQKLQGRALVSGFVKFNVACSFGALANYAVSTHLFQSGIPQMTSVIIGAFTGVLWNYAMNRIFTWRGN